MRRSMPSVLLLALVALLARPAPADEFTDLKKQFRLSFRSTAPAEERLRAVAGLSALKRKDSAALLISGIPISQLHI